MRTTGVPRYHLNSLILYHKGREGALRVLINALCDWLSPVYAVTGKPVTVYSAMTFLRQVLQATSALLPCGDFHDTSPSLSSCLTLTTPEYLRLYARENIASRNTQI